MEVSEAGPTIKVTGIEMSCGTASAAWTATVARYTPGDSPAADACKVTVPGPLPETGEIESQLLVRLAGSTRADQRGVPPEKFRSTVEGAGCAGSVTCHTTAVRPAENVAGAADAGKRPVVAEAVRVTPVSLEPVN